MGENVSIIIPGPAYVIIIIVGVVIGYITRNRKKETVRVRTKRFIAASIVEILETQPMLAIRKRESAFFDFSITYIGELLVVDIIESYRLDTHPMDVMTAYLQVKALAKIKKFKKMSVKVLENTYFVVPEMKLNEDWGYMRFVGNKVELLDQFKRKFESILIVDDLVEIGSYKFKINEANLSVEIESPDGSLAWSLSDGFQSPKKILVE